ncbi:MAG: Maf family protein [Acetomicrobium sp.]
MDRSVPIVLSSNSPRRRSLLSDLLGWNVLFISPDVEENVGDFNSPSQAVELLAEKKALFGANLYPERYVIGADTIVYMDGRILGKPTSKKEALDMLSLLNGSTHEVYTGVAVAKADRIISDHEVTKVTFRRMNIKALLAYLDTEEGMDKAGAYGIQGKGALLVERIEGCYFNVVGLPLATLSKVLERMGWPLEAQWRCVK